MQFQVLTGAHFSLQFLWEPPETPSAPHAHLGRRDSAPRVKVSHGEFGSIEIATLRDAPWQRREASSYGNIKDINKIEQPNKSGIQIIQRLMEHGTLKSHPRMLILLRSSLGT